MKLLAISGGPDSMFLLNDHKHKKNIVVCHVNYNKRNDSSIDENIVRDFCLKNKISLEIHSLNEKYEGNFQNWARNKRYDFFKEIYNKYNCDELLMGHHKDDFLETAFMQMESKRTPKYFGIRKKNLINGMNIKRPYLFSYWKKDILYFLKKHKISFAIDSSNEKPIFKRNRIRIKLNSKTQKEKNDLYKWFKMSNKILIKKHKKIDNLYKYWKRIELSLDFFKTTKYQEELLFDLLNEKYENVKLSSNKIKGLIDFLCSNEGGKKFLIDKNKYITKKKNKIIFY